jgi:hypothetical protein
MAREIFEVLQKEINSKRKTIDEINIKVIQEVAIDIGAMHCTHSHSLLSIKPKFVLSQLLIVLTMGK